MYRMQHLFKKNQSGRSMIEMLGVLAIIGVLTVGGLQGYEYVMKRHRISTTIQQVAVAMQSARGLFLKKITSDDIDENGCIPIRYVMQGVDLCEEGNDRSFKTEIGACVSVCRNARGIWYMDISFDNVPTDEDLITVTDCRTILLSQIAKDGFLTDPDGTISTYDNLEDIAAVCDLFSASNRGNSSDSSDE